MRLWPMLSIAALLALPRAGAAEALTRATLQITVQGIPSHSRTARPEALSNGARSASRSNPLLVCDELLRRQLKSRRPPPL